MSKRSRTVIFLLIVAIGAFILLRSIIGDIVLKKNGQCIKAILINETNKVKSHKPTLLYEFIAEGESYTGNSLEEDLSKVGDSICVTFLKSFPSINRPIKYFDSGETKCACPN